MRSLTDDHVHDRVELMSAQMLLTWTMTAEAVLARTRFPRDHLGPSSRHDKTRSELGRKQDLRVRLSSSAESCQSKSPWSITILKVCDPDVADCQRAPDHESVRICPSCATKQLSTWFTASMRNCVSWIMDLHRHVCQTILGPDDIVVFFRKITDARRDPGQVIFFIMS